MRRHPMLRATIFTICLAALLAAPCGAENQALKNECESKAQKAADLIQSLGSEAAFQKIIDPKGAFVGKNSHVFCITADSGKLLAHKIARFVGYDMHRYEDADGNNPYVALIQKAKQVPSGWTKYLTHGSGPERRKVPEWKHMHFLKVPGKNIILCCGYWNDA